MANDLQGAQQQINQFLSALERAKYACQLMQQRTDEAVTALEKLTLLKPLRFGPMTGGEYPKDPAPVVEIQSKWSAGSLVLVKIAGIGMPFVAGWYRVMNVGDLGMSIKSLDRMKDETVILPRPDKWIVATRYVDAFGAG